MIPFVCFSVIFDTFGVKLLTIVRPARESLIRCLHVDLFFVQNKFQKYYQLPIKSVSEKVEDL